MFIFIAGAVFAQEFNLEQQYQQAMQNAKTAFEAKQYSQSVMFYREAQKIKPDALLPKYKIEDIRTIYIENELDSLIVENPVIENVSRKQKKQLEQEVNQAEEKAAQTATLKMNKEAEKAREELETLKISVIEITETEPETDIELPEVNQIVADRETGIEGLKQKEQTALEGGLQQTSKPEIVSIKMQDPELETYPENSIKPLNPVNKQLTTVVKPKPEVLTTTVNKDKPTSEWIAREEQKLKVKYPNKKTVEQEDLPGKQITRVIMHIDNKITTYLKVRHSWGATYFFIDEVGQELRSINEQYFNLMTNLSTYGN
ncbi:MAG: hypothetical protein CVU09_15610 [Bacteroidetes bacterium HGW-Bacteroidetes-4]|nr:MAG: hypothetical protein CVU09_15610 [Bacteroidetes bacterium HGW-Bacteroidetes-4]